jgi:hypothetical protein
MADGSSAVLYAVPEQSIGTTPATPAFFEVPFNSDNLVSAFESIESERLGGRNARCHRLGNKSADGDVSTYFYPVHVDSFLEAAFCGSWSNDVLTTGDTRRGFTFERQHLDVTPTPYLRFIGCEINELTIQATAGQNVNLSLSIVGNEQDESFTQISGSTYSQVPDDCPYSSWEGNLELDGVEVATATELSITIANGLERLYGIGSRTAHRKSIGKINVTGSITLEFESVAIYQKWQSEQTSVLVLTLEATNGYKHEIEVPKLKFTAVQSPVAGEGQVTLQAEFSGRYDSSEESELLATRTIPAE